MFTKPCPNTAISRIKTPVYELVIDKDGSSISNVYYVEDRFVPTALEFEDAKPDTLTDAGVPLKSLNIVSDRRLDDSELAAFEAAVDAAIENSNNE